MSKKDDLIAQLEGNLAAHRMVIRGVGESLGVAIREDITMENASRYLLSFGAAVHRLKQSANNEPDTIRRGHGEGLTGGRLDTFDELVDEEIARLDAKGLTVPRDRASVPSPGVNQRIDALARRTNEWSTRTDLDDGRTLVERRTHGGHEGRETLENIAEELDINIDGTSIPEALLEVHREIVRIKNPSGDVSAEAGDTALTKGDSLAQAIQHTRREARTLETGLRDARNIVARVAAALQVGQWDADGTEIIEKAQRWDGFRHTIKNRLTACRNGSTDGSFEAIQTPRPLSFEYTGRIAELEYLLSLLVAPKELANWLKTRPSAASPMLVDLAQSSPRPLKTRPFTMSDVAEVTRALRATGSIAAPCHHAVRTLIDVSEFVTIRSELATIINNVILPMYERMPLPPPKAEQVV